MFTRAQPAPARPDLSPARAVALEKEAATGAPAGAMVLPDGHVVTGKTGDLLGAARWRWKWREVPRIGGEHRRGCPHPAVRRHIVPDWSWLAAI